MNFRREPKSSIKTDNKDLSSVDIRTFKNAIVAITGTVPGFTRQQFVTRLERAHGITTKANVTKKIKALITGSVVISKTPSIKEARARELGIPIVSYKEFLRS